uniref:Phospholipid-transporting ATPase n=1 Tax=Panagrolaimus sp. JU765 TaxID=591449 RepID=A0AC34QT05_9BILA
MVADDTPSTSSITSTFPVHRPTDLNNRAERVTTNFPVNPQQTTPGSALRGHQRRASSASTGLRVTFSPEVRENIYSPPPEVSTTLSQRRKSYSYGGPATVFDVQPVNSAALAAAAAYRQHADAAAVAVIKHSENQKIDKEKSFQPPKKLLSSSKNYNWTTRWIEKMGEIFSKYFGGNAMKKNGGSSSRRSSTIVGETDRVLKANDRAFNAQFKYADNYIKTSKYNIFTFIPKNLFEQFQRLANFYFLILMILQFIPWISSIAWYSTAIPLFIVLAFSAIKDGYDDIQRHRSDSQVNSRISYIVRDGKLEEEKWMNVKVGDVIRMENEHFIAADLLVLSSSEPHGLCYIETAELDGETNLKTRSALRETVPLGDIVRNISNFNGQITCEPPNNRLDRFEGKITIDGTSYPISNENMLLRGCRLRNTRWCYGVVIFAGKDTKLMMNSGKTKFKRTSLDRFLNILIMGIVLFLIAMCLICTILCGVWEWVTGRNFTTYLEWDKSIVPSVGDKGARQIAIIAFLMFFSYIILLNTVVPISLYVSVEILRFVHSLWINFDREMYDAKSDTSARARTTTLNEELGQVQYIFSDKTGTLTQNIMTFNKCSINGRSYGDLINERQEYIEINENTPKVDFSFNPWSEKTFKFYDRTLLDDTKKGVPEVKEFWKLLALCHTVMPEQKMAGPLEYQAQSPDEAALTSAARNFGYVFKSRTPQSITIEVNGKEEIYEVLHLLDFNNVRKRMSVIVKGRNGKLKLYCKGADTIIMEMLKNDTSPLLRDATMQHLDKFASDGLRTLCLAYKDIDEAYCTDWLARLKEASLDRYNKDERVDQLYTEIETGLTLIGATAIEDKLQEGVPETIAKLTAANIKIWVLTGDKTETAINIGYSCKLLTEDMKEVFVVDGEEENEVEVQLKDIRRRISQTTLQNAPGNSAFYDSTTANGQNYNYNIVQFHQDQQIQDTTPAVVVGDETGYLPTAPDNVRPLQEAEDPNLPPQEGFALVINGRSLAHALKPKFERMFLEIGCMMVSVICCRVTPLQKAQVVDLVKKNKKAVTLSVGDGANDVSMIKTAHIGVGISGQEGMQAVLASDFSIAQFRYLQRLLLVHGRWSYYRMCKFLRYFFYKNFSFTLTHFWYSFFSGYSAQTVYDPLMITCYNMFFTSLPVLSMGIFDQDVNDEYSLKYPKLYIPGQYNLFFNMRIFIYSVFHGMLSSLVIFFIPYGALYNATDSSGRDMNDYSMLAFTTFTSLIVAVTGQIILDTAYWTVFTHIVIWGSLAFYAGLVLILYEAFPIKVLLNTQALMSYGVIFRALTSAQFWFTLLLVVVILVLPIMLNRFFWFDTHPSYADRLRVRHKHPEIARMEAEGFKPPRSAVTRRSRRGSLRSGYAFSHSAGFGELIAKGKLFRDIEHLKQPTSSKKSLSPIVETPPGLIGAAVTVPLTPTSGPSSRAQSSMSTTHSITVNQGDDPLPPSWPASTTIPATSKPTHPGYTAVTAPTRSTPRPKQTHFSANPPNMPPPAGTKRRPEDLNIRSSPMPLPGSNGSDNSSNGNGPRFVGKQRRHQETQDDRPSIDSIDRIVERF